VYGVPSLYYGDEAGVEGYHDPFCRLPYPWGRENKKLLEFYTKLGKIREQNREIFARGEFKMLCSDSSILAYERYIGRERVVIITNASKEKTNFKLRGEWKDLLTEKSYDGTVGAYGKLILKKSRG
jgi:glycosidase